ncbi:MAG: hypothetical protein P1U34_07320 [Coxiellaceae bacterium]|nr:hypothetical protein [Coxiellaceae bacterium]
MSPAAASTQPYITSYRSCYQSLGNLVGSFGVASPIIFLNMLASASSKSNNAISINSLEDLQQFFDKTNSFNRFSMAITFAASACVLTFLNRLYLWPSITSSKKLFTVPYDFYTRHNTTKHKTTKEIKAIENSMKRWPADIIFCVWSLATSLIFGEIGSKSFAFMGIGGEVVGFFLSFSIHYASRFLSIQYFIDEQLDRNLKIKKLYIHKLEKLQKENCPCITITDPRSTQQVLHTFLNQIDEQWDHLAKNKWQHFWMHTAAKILGSGLFLFLTVPIFAGFMPECVQGAELLFNTSIGEDSEYKNAASFGFGGFATTLTWFFYSVNAYALPKALINTAYDCHHHATQGSKVQAAKYSLLTIAACVSSYLTSPSFRLVGQHTYSQGYISYLGNYGRLVPGALSTAFIFMLWSHLQNMIHDASLKRQSRHINESIMDVDHALKLLRREDTNLYENIDTQPLQSVVIDDDRRGITNREHKDSGYEPALQHSPTPGESPIPRTLTSTPPTERVGLSTTPKPRRSSFGLTGRHTRTSQITPSPAPAPSPFL